VSDTSHIIGKRIGWSKIPNQLKEYDVLPEGMFKPGPMMPSKAIPGGVIPSPPSQSAFDQLAARVEKLEQKIKELEKL